MGLGSHKYPKIGMDYGHITLISNIKLVDDIRSLKQIQRGQDSENKDTENFKMLP